MCAENESWKSFFSSHSLLLVLLMLHANLFVVICLFFMSVHKGKRKVSQTTGVHPLQGATLTLFFTYVVPLILQRLILEKACLMYWRHMTVMRWVEHLLYIIVLYSQWYMFMLFVAKVISSSSFNCYVYSSTFSIHIGRELCQSGNFFAYLSSTSQKYSRNITVTFIFECVHMNTWMTSLQCSNRDRSEGIENKIIKNFSPSPWSTVCYRAIHKNSENEFQ